jgi:hypothetical protein
MVRVTCPGCHKDQVCGISCSFTAARDTTSEDEVMDARIACSARGSPRSSASGSPTPACHVASVACCRTFSTTHEQVGQTVEGCGLL